MTARTTAGRRFAIAALIVALVVAASGCGSGVKRPARVPIGPAESIDPFAYGDEFARPDTGVAPVAAQDGPQGTAPEEPVMQEPPQQPGGSRLPVADGVVYRIQLGSVFEDRDEAESYARRARNRLDGEITVEYRPPFYRVYAGSFSTQRDAESYVQLLKQEGFRESRWVAERPAAQ